MQLVNAVRHGMSGCVDNVGEDAWSESGTLVGDGGGEGSGICHGGSVGQRCGGSGSVADDLTSHAMKGSKVCGLGDGNFGGVDNGQGWTNGQSVAGYAVSQSVSNVVSPQDIAFRTQVAEAANLVTSSILKRWELSLGVVGLVKTVYSL